MKLYAFLALALHRIRFDFRERWADLCACVWLNHGKEQIEKHTYQECLNTYAHTHKTQTLANKHTLPYKHTPHKYTSIQTHTTSQTPTSQTQKQTNTDPLIKA